jgi:hypothetical protein
MIESFVNLKNFDEIEAAKLPLIPQCSVNVLFPE